MQRLYFHQIDTCQYRVIDLEDAAVLPVLFKEVAIRAYINRRVCDYLLPKRVYRRIRDLCEELFEIVEKLLMLL